MLLLRTHRLSQLRSSAAARSDTHVGIAPVGLRRVWGLRTPWRSEPYRHRGWLPSTWLMATVEGTGIALHRLHEGCQGCCVMAYQSALPVRVSAGD